MSKKVRSARGPVNFEAERSRFSGLDRDRDVLAIGTPEDNALISRWSLALPLSLQGKSVRIQRTVRPLDLLGGLSFAVDDELLQRLADLRAAIAGRLDPGRGVEGLRAAFATVFKTIILWRRPNGELYLVLKPVQPRWASAFLSEIPSESHWARPAPRCLLAALQISIFRI